MIKTEASAYVTKESMTIRFRLDKDDAPRYHVYIDIESDAPKFVEGAIDYAAGSSFSFDDRLLASKYFEESLRMYRNLGFVDTPDPEDQYTVAEYNYEQTPEGLR